MKIRSITCFYDPGMLKADSTLEMLSNLSKECKKIFHDNGYEVQTIRLATVPFSRIKPENNKPELVKLTNTMETKAKIFAFHYP